MARIAGVELPRERRIDAGLTSIYGIGWTTSKEILEQADVAPKTRVNDLTEDEVTRLRNIVENNHSVEGDLRRELQMNVKRLMDIGSYRGLRHRRNLPVRGQRTSTNARTRRGGYKAKRTIAVGRKAKETARKGG
ncbi:30S ribosomal protein S13 [Candidatus Poribacteria bacterium]|nr:30S ribosomal protein S13 [Candidatus Poribacteria bacterium]